MKIVVDDKIPFLKGVLEPYAKVDYLPGKNIENSSLRDADALIVRTRTKCNKQLLEGTAVKFIATATIGHDHIDKEYCKEKGITWTNAPGCNSGSVQQYIASALFYLAYKKKFCLNEKTLGIVGVGNVGKKVEKMARIFNMNVLLNDPPRARSEGKQKFVSLDEIMAQSDIITWHVPLSHDGEDKTYHLLGEENIRKLRKDTIIINTSRGEVMDTRVVLNALENKKIGGAIFDVWENEPKPDNRLLQLADIGTPHIAGYSMDGKANGTAMCIQSLSRSFNLDLYDWFPGDVPLPENNSFIIDCTQKTDQQILHEAILVTYDIMEDDRSLRNTPEKFEYLRGNYRIRREFGNFNVTLKNGSNEVLAKLQALGFKVSGKKN